MATYTTEREPRVETTAEPTFSMASIAAVVCAVASFFAGAALGVILALAAIVLGIVGALAALGPRTRGGVMSITSIFAGAAGAVAAVIRLIMYLAGA